MRTHSVDWYHHLPAHVKEILATLQGAGFEAYIAGGAVRDLWMGLKPKDFDLASSATPEEVEKLFPRTEGVGKQFGIMIVITEGGPVEVARFRADAEYKDGRHPTGVVFSSPEEDAKRRDFTINGLFYHPAKGEVLDYVGGVEDLEAKLIRCVGDPALRFEEDSLRMLRAVRFHAQLPGFYLDAELVQAVRKHSPRLNLVSRERITQEMLKVFLSPRPSVGIFDLVLMNLWAPVFGCPEPNASVHANFDVLGEIYTGLTNRPAESPLFLAGAARWFNGWKAEESFVLTREAKATLKAVPGFLESLRRYFSLERARKKILLAEPHAAEAVAILRVDGDEDLLNLLDEAWADRERWEQSGLLNPAPLLTGADLLAAGHQPGPQIKTLLEKARLAQLNEEITTKEEALAKMRTK